MASTGRATPAAHAPPIPVWSPWLGWLAAAMAFACGLATDALSAGSQVNILAAPLLTVMAWNVAVYLAIAAQSLATALGRPVRPAGPLVAIVGRALAVAARHGFAHLAPPREAGVPFVDRWRISQVLHVAAAALTLGLIAGLYLRGLAFEYLAGWQSTFLEPATVRRLLGVVLGPASALTGIALPDAERLAAIRAGAGPGENAARWIHLYAATALLIVVMPRTLLALLARRRALAAARMLAGAAPAGPGPDFGDLAGCIDDRTSTVLALPYSYRLPPASRDGLGTLVAAELGPRARLELAPAQSPEQTAADVVPAPPGAYAVVLAVFALEAIPESQTQGAFVAALRRQLPASVPLRVIVDETRFAERFAHVPTRIVERRAAWRSVLAPAGVEPRFVALGALAEQAQ